MKPRFEIKATGNTSDVWLYGEIGHDITLDAFRTGVRSLGPKVQDINLYVNSPGGNVFDGVAMHSILLRHPGKVYAHVDGLAASAASVVIMAAAHITSAGGGMVMIHEPQGVAIGGISHMRSMAEAMERVRGQMADIYARRTGMPRLKILELMAAETWMTADEAFEMGFVDEVNPGRQIAACVINSARFQYHRAPVPAVGRPVRDRAVELVERMAAARPRALAPEQSASAAAARID